QPAPAIPAKSTAAAAGWSYPGTRPSHRSGNTWPRSTADPAHPATPDDPSGQPDPTSLPDATSTDASAASSQQGGGQADSRAWTTAARSGCRSTGNRSAPSASAARGAPARPPPAGGATPAPTRSPSPMHQPPG